MATETPERPVTKSRKGIKRAAIAAGGIFLLLAGVGIGAASNSQASLVASQKAQIARLQSQQAAERASVTTMQGKVAAAQQTAQGAVLAANAKAAAKYATREAKVQAMQRKLNRELGVVAKSTISAPGVYVVGKDIPAGTYHTSGDGGSSGIGCYYATLGSTNTSNILDNNNFDGPETVNLGGVYAFQINGDCTWHKAG